MSKNTKYKKVSRKLFAKEDISIAKRNSFPRKFLYGIQSTDSFLINEKHIETLRRICASVSKRSAFYISKIRANKPYTKKALGLRMGGGKAGIESYVSRVRPGNILFEFDNVSLEIANEILEKVSSKLPVRCKLKTLKFAYSY